MKAAARDRITVDLRGLKAALVERARVHGVSPSDLVRHLVAEALEPQGDSAHAGPAHAAAMEPGERTRVSLRMHRHEAEALFMAARAAAMPAGAFVAGLVAGVPALEHGAAPRNHVAALVASNAEMSTLAKSVHHLAALLRQGSVRAAQEYQTTLADLDAHVRNHLALSAEVLAQLQPRRASATRVTSVSAGRAR
jgi:hypothetical protein